MTFDAERQAILIVRDQVDVATLTAMAHEMFGELVKAVVDIERAIMAIGGEMHADEEVQLLDDGSRQSDLWGVNLYPEQHDSDDFVEFDSMINLRPGLGNRTRGVDDADTRTAILAVVGRLVRP